MVLRKKILFLSCASLLLVGCSHTTLSLKTQPTSAPQGTTTEQVLSQEDATPQQPNVKRVAMAASDARFQFSVEIPFSWEVEFVDAIDSLNIYDPAFEADSIREQSQIFIRFFEASAFLTLATVDILARESTMVNGHDAVRYEIQKKSDVADFSHQPSWRNTQHKLVDVRFSSSNPTTFFVFAYHPKLDESVFETFMGSLQFANDAASFRAPLDRAQERIPVKPFGLLVSPTSSPVNPERFAGFHTGTDFEIFPDEQEADITVLSLCGGPVIQKEYLDGYGGVVVQSCFLDDQPLRIIYGHVRLGSVAAVRNAYLVPGQPIGVLGKGNSDETDFERKHLHLGIVKGEAIDVRGYVPDKEDLATWVDPCTLVC